MGGSTLLDGNTRNIGWMAINEYLRVRNNKGIVRTINSGQLKVEIIAQSGYAIGGLAPGTSLTGNQVNFVESYTGSPTVIVGQISGGNFSSGNVHSLMITASNVTSTSCRFVLTNTGTSTIAGTNISFQALVIGSE